MARPLRLELPGGVYHITARGNERKLIYRDDIDRTRFQEVLAQVLSRFHWLCLAYCQMGNHYHLLVETPLPNLSRGMRQLNGVYAQQFNRRHNRVGHLTQGRYGAILVEQGEHLLSTVRYIVRNPVRAGLCAAPEDWHWSSYRATLGLEPLGLVAIDALLEQLAETRSQARERLRAFVDEPGDRPLDPAGVILGDEPFQRNHTDDLYPAPEIPRDHWQPVRPPLEQILHGRPRNEAIAAAYRTHGYHMNEIAQVLGCHYATISRRLRTYETQTMSERKT